MNKYYDFSAQGEGVGRNLHEYSLVSHNGWLNNEIHIINEDQELKDKFLSQLISKV